MTNEKKLERQRANGKEKFVLTYGFRRFSACKKLGWKTIPSFLPSESRVINVDVNDIEILNHKNSRLNEDTEGFNELMQSIRDNGLLEPIGISREDDLTAENFATLNITENLHRENLTPYELGTSCRRLREMGLSASQIAIRLTLPKSRIDALLNIGNSMPQELEESAFMDKGDRKNSAKNGKVPFTILKRVSNYRFAGKIKSELLTAIKDKDLSMVQVDLIIELLKKGISLQEGIKELEKYETFSGKFVIVKKEFEKYKGITKSNLLSLMLKGKIPLNPKLIYFNKGVKKEALEKEEE